MEPQYDCGLGTVILSVDLDGNIYPCHRFSSDDTTILGNVTNVENINMSYKSIPNSTCQNCWNKYTCSHGCKYNDKWVAGNEGGKLPYWCVYSQKMSELSLILCAELSQKHIQRILQIP
jgi:uncharacterized protein